MVDVQHCPLRAFEQHGLPRIQRAVQQFRRIANVPANVFAQLQGLIHFMRKVDVRAVRALREPVLLRHHVRRFLSKQLRLQQVAHAQPAPRHLVFICRADPAGGGANLVRAARAFRRLVQLPVIRKNEVSAIADVQSPFHVNPSLGERRNFRDQRRRVHHRARPDHRLLLGPKNSARNQLQHVAVFSDDDRVPRVVAACDACNVVKRSRKVVHHLAFTFVAPLRAHHHDGFHASLLPKVAQAFLPVASLSPTTLQLLRVHITLTSLESTKKRQVLIVSSPRVQRKRAVIRSQGKFLLGALFGRADSHARQPSEIRATFLFAAFSASGRRAPLTTPKLLLTANRNLVCSLFPVDRLKERMPSPKSEVLQGTLDLLVLKTLDSMGPMHGFGISLRIQQVSDELLQLNQRQLYPALLRIEQRGWIASKWGVSENNRKAKYYSLTHAGRKQLEQEVESWDRMSAVINRVLRTT